MMNQNSMFANCSSPSLEDTRPQSEIKFHVPHHVAGMRDAIDDALKIGRFRAGGEFSEKSIIQLKNLTSAREVFLTNSCTSALEIAALSLNLGPDDEVIIPSFTFAGSATPFARGRSKIIFCDINPRTMMMDAESVAKVITPKTKVIVVVHYGGNSVVMEPIMELASRHKIVVIEDAAQGVGASRSGVSLGAIGHLGAYSFHETKVVNSGHGGALLVNHCDDEIMDRIVSAFNRGTNFASYLKDGFSHYEWIGHGSSFELSELQAVLLSEQLLNLNDIVKLRMKIVDVYAKLFSASGIYFLRQDQETKGNGHFFALVLENAKVAKGLIEYAMVHGIEMRSHYKPLHMSKYAKQLGYVVNDCPNAAAFWDRIVRLPVHTAMDVSDAERVVDLVTSFAKKQK